MLRCIKLTWNEIEKKNKKNVNFNKNKNYVKRNKMNFQISSYEAFYGAIFENLNLVLRPT